MKKVILLVCFSVFLTAGCGAEKTMTCSRTMNQSGMQVDLKYEVNYSNDTVKRVKSTEKVTSDSKELLDNYKTTIEATYEPYKDLESYDYNVSIDGNTLTSTADINYEKVDTKKMIEIDSANSQLIKNGKVSVNDLKSAYESLGATCEK